MLLERSKASSLVFLAPSRKLVPKYGIRLFFAILSIVTSRVCIVSFTDADSLRHSVEVSAGSLYEAAALGLRAFRNSDLTEKIGMAGAKVLRVEAKAETETHEVELRKLTEWVETQGRTPREQALKVRLREALLPR